MSSTLRSLFLSIVTVIVSATAAGVQAQEEQTKPAPAPAPVVPQGPGVHALIIGISEYPNFPRNDLTRFADRDAQLFHDALQNSPLRSALRSVTVITNSTAQRRNILEAVNTIGGNAGPDDLLFIFFAGHGTVDSLGRGFIMPNDADPNFPENNGIPSDFFISQIAASTTAENIVLLMDASHEIGLTSSIMEEFQRQFAGRDGNYVALLSARANQRSFDDPNFEHGIFTWYLVEALQGRADRAETGNSDGFVTLRELYRNVVDRVEDRAVQTIGEMQTPIISPDYDPVFLPFNFGVRLGSGAPMAPEDIQQHLDRAAQLERVQDYHGAAQAYSRVLEITPSHTQARERLAYITHEHTYEYERSREVSAYWSERDQQDPAKLVAYAQTLFTTGHYDEFEAFVVGLLADDAFDRRLGVVLRALRIGNFIALQEEARAIRGIASLVAEISQYQDSEFETEWTFFGVRNYIQNHERAFGQHRDWLMEFLNTLQSERGRGITSRIQSMR